MNRRVLIVTLVLAAALCAFGFFLVDRPLAEWVRASGIENAAVFVYGLIGWTVNLSLQKRHNALPSKGFAGLSNYTDLFTKDISGRFTHSLENLGVFTLVFIAGTLLLGFLWAFLLERGARAEGFFRTVYLFPMAVSFVASGVVWRWLMNPGKGSSAGGIMPRSIMARRSSYCSLRRR